MEAPSLNTKNGYITLMSVLIASAVVVSISLALLQLGINASKTMGIIQDTKYANSFARSCAEEALSQIRNSASFSGPGNLSFKEGSCLYNVLNTGGQNRIVNATGTSDMAIRRIFVNINVITPKINVLSWQEVGDF